MLDTLDVKLSYELWFSEDAILNPIETQMCTAAAITCTEAPLQAMWHTRGIVRHGGTIETAKFAQELALRVAKEFNCTTGPVQLVKDINWNDEKAYK
jgi:hypothetical protein